ncbi:MAG: PTS IIA-like nitrogen-regulatory protein PtsN [Alphaproteobacteria bacterium TMED87]|nr:PTS IIA-like nitrogen-regulatory protein PtsN [Rhodospirillaceae bacterium]OUV09181.1 MAG: PTS IIA-like nitrogen-regulatory protein PtsN [Alphaproteobacteria bacterium TMED87]|tara:strand:- start:453 stop:911 length:459 start_codon:yes stop_codon:yes gene_type:complete
MDISDFLQNDAVITLRASSKKQLLQDLAKQAKVLTGLNDAKIFEVLLEREKLGSTGLGKGVAIPHGKLSGLSSLQGIFAKLDKPIDFDSVDNSPVDLVFLLLAPEQAGADHLTALARVSRYLRKQDNCEKLRNTDDQDGLYILLTQNEAQAA